MNFEDLGYLSMREYSADVEQELRIYDSQFTDDRKSKALQKKYRHDDIMVRDADILMEYGVVKCLVDDAKNATIAFNEVLLLDENRTEAHEALAISLLAQNRTELGLKHLNQALVSSKHLHELYLYQSALEPEFRDYVCGVVIAVVSLLKIDGNVSALCASFVKLRVKTRKMERKLLKNHSFVGLRKSLNKRVSGLLENWYSYLFQQRDSSQSLQLELRKLDRERETFGHQVLIEEEGGGVWRVRNDPLTTLLSLLLTESMESLTKRQLLMASSEVRLVAPNADAELLSPRFAKHDVVSSFRLGKCANETMEVSIHQQREEEQSTNVTLKKRQLLVHDSTVVVEAGGERDCTFFTVDLGWRAVGKNSCVLPWWLV